MRYWALNSDVRIMNLNLKVQNVEYRKFVTEKVHSILGHDFEEIVLDIE